MSPTPVTNSPTSRSSITADGRYIFYQAWTEPDRFSPRDRTYSYKELIQKETLFPTGNTYDVYWIEARIVGDAKPKGEREARGKERNP